MKSVFIFIVSLLSIICNGTLICQAQDYHSLKQAEQYIKRNEYFKAIDIINDFLKNSSQDIVALKLRAKCYSKTGKVDEAILDLEAVVKIDSKDVESNLLLGKLYGKKNELTKAVSILEFNQSLKKAPQENQYYLLYYQILTGKAEVAFKFISNQFVQGLNSNDPLFWYLQGLAMDSTNRRAGSDNKYTVAINLLPSFSEFNEKYDELTELFPYTNFFIVRADRLFADSIYDQAKLLYQRVLLVDKLNYDCLFKTGYCLYKTDKVNESEIYFKQCKEIAPNKSQVYYFLGQMEYNRRNWLQAQEYFKIAIEFKDPNPRLLIYAGHCSFELVKYAEALSYYKKAFLVTEADAISKTEWLKLNDNYQEVEKVRWRQNMELNPPQLIISRPSSAKKDKLSWNRGTLRRVEFNIKDQSAIKFVKVNNDTLKCDTTIFEPPFVYDFKLTDTEGVFVYSDVYDGKEDEKDKFDPMMTEAEKILLDYLCIASDRVARTK